MENFTVSLRAAFAVGVSIASLWGAPIAHADTNLIPKPESMHILEGAPFVLGPNTPLIATGEAATEAGFLAEQLRAATGFTLPIKTAGEGSITLRLEPSLQGDVGNEGYKLQSNANGVLIRAATRAGLFYGGQSLRALLPPQIMRGKPAKDRVLWSVPAVSIEDQPRFAWRGYMLDDSRHFFGFDYVKHLLDNMAAHKFNVLHWHLTDDEGWRIEIKNLPKLTEIGAWRGSETKLPNVRGEKHTRYGGFYTQDQIREIVAYAKARHIEIMPEVDLPGHALALIGSYPEAAPLVGGDGISATGFADNVISPVRPEALAIVDKIYDEVAELFPFKYIHIGGDEVNYGFWKNDPQIKAFMEKEKLKNLHEVQVAFTKRLEGIVAQKGKKLFGWNEILDNRLDHGTGIMSWTGVGPGYDAARRGFPVVMSPAQHSYLDMGYGGGAVGEPEGHSWAGNVTLQRMYSFDPLGDGGNLSTEEKARIMGVQAHGWAEFIRAGNTGMIEFKTDQQALDYKLWPRLLATSEIAWTPQYQRNFTDFMRRLDADEYERLAQTNTFFRVPPPDAATIKNGVVSIEGPFPEADVHYTFDGTDPTEASPRYEKPFALEGRDAGRLRARTFFDGRGSTLIVGAKAQPIGSWKNGELTTQPKEYSFDASGNLTAGGVWRAAFQRTGGDKPLRLDKATVLVDGVLVAQSDEISNKGDRAVARFEVPPFAANAKVTVQATLTAPDGGNVAGAVTLQKSNRLEPKVTIASPYPAYQSNTAAMAADWDDDTFFWISDFPKAGTLATWTFAEAVSAQYVSVSSGERNGTKDQLLGGALEISEDGTNFRKVAEFTYGSAAADLPNGTKVKAIRVQSTQEQKTWVMLRDPVLR